jgi:hypothetical protein
MVEQRTLTPLVEVRVLDPQPYIEYAAIAQSVEHSLGKGKVAGSIPVGSTISR